MAQQKFKRRNFFISPRFQGGHMLSFVIFALVTAAAIFAIAGYLFLFEFDFFGAHRVRQEVISRRIFHDFLWILAAVAAVGLFRSLFTSHRVAGPIFRFKKTCRELEAGNLGVRVFLRKKDKLKDLKDAMNRALETICQGVSKDRDRRDEIASICEELKRSPGHDPGLDEKLGRMIELARGIGSSFVLPSDAEKCGGN